MAVDPWAGYNTGIQNLGGTFEDIRREQKEAPLRALQLRMLQQKAEEGDIQQQQMQQNFADIQGARKAAASLVPQTTTTGGYSQSTAPQTSAAFKLLQNSSDMMNSAKAADIAGLKQNIEQNPELAKLSGSVERLKSYQTDNTKLPATDLITPNMAAGVEVPQTTKTTPVTSAARTKAQIDYFLSVGNTAEADKLKANVAAQAKNLMDITGDMGTALNFLNESTGLNLTLSKMHKLNILKDGDGNATQVIDESGVAKDQAAGLPLSQAIANNTIDLRGPEGGDARRLQNWIGSQKEMPTLLQTFAWGAKNGIDPKAKGVEKLQELTRRGDKDEAMHQQFLTSQERIASQFATTQERIANNANKEKPAKPLPAGQLEGLADARKMIDNLEEAKRLSPEVETGMVSGRIQSGAAMVGKAPKKFVEFKQKIATVNNIMLKLRSGAAVTEQEYSRFLQEMPTVNDPPETRDVKLNGAIKYAKGLMNEKALNFEEGGYKVPEHIKRGRTEPTTAVTAENKTAAVIPATVMPKIAKAVGTMKEGQHFSFTVDGRTVTGTRKGGKPVFD